MEVYNEIDADYLLEYYKDKVDGQTMSDVDIRYKVDNLQKVDVGNNQYAVVGYLTPVTGGVLLIKRRILHIATSMGLKLPDDVLASRNQPQ